TQFISAELMENQLRLLLKSLERKIVSQQLNLVRTHITLGSFQGEAGAMLLFPHGEEQRLTMELVELSGVELQANGSVMSWGKSFEAVAALFVALYILNLLSG
ncbi:GSDA3 protein, partial [Rhadina sibilatrix]|nr:GSDA3 protein [Rhadina sibilatrix]